MIQISYGADGVAQGVEHQEYHQEKTKTNKQKTKQGWRCASVEQLPSKCEAPVLQKQKQASSFLQSVVNFFLLFLISIYSL
jgi:hypothetical protein